MQRRHIKPDIKALGVEKEPYAAAAAGGGCANTSLGIFSPGFFFLPERQNNSHTPFSPPQESKAHEFDIFRLSGVHFQKVCKDLLQTIQRIFQSRCLSTSAYGAGIYFCSGSEYCFQGYDQFAAVSDTNYGK